jgi:hypothetical protein
LSNPFLRKQDLLALTSIPHASQNKEMISEKVFHLSKVPLPNSKTSSENNNMILVMSNSQFDT